MICQVVCILQSKRRLVLASIAVGMCSRDEDEIESCYSDLGVYFAEQENINMNIFEQWCRFKVNRGILLEACGRHPHKISSVAHPHKNSSTSTIILLEQRCTTKTRASNSYEGSV